MRKPPEPQWSDLAVQVGSVFTPTSPIDARALFAGRDEQVRLIVDVINQKGQHAILYGERGVGKTSLVNILPSFLSASGRTVLAPRTNCDSTDSFGSIWHKLFEQLELTRTAPVVGFGPQEQLTFSYNTLLGDQPATPDVVRRALTRLAQTVLPIFIVDEFDRLAATPRRAFADTIKSLSDHSVGATIILVGVADSVEQLLDEHRSVERALVQVRMPRMAREEIQSILATGTAKLGMTITAVANSRIAKLSQGLPHYAHLLGLHASRNALDSRRLEVTPDDVTAAVRKAIDGAQHSIRSAYDIAVRSPRKDSLFADVLLACALAESNELGFFAAQDVREPMQRMTGKLYQIPSFAQHLNEFTLEKRGPIFDKGGSPKRFRYRFRNPLLQPFVIMRGLVSQRIGHDALD